MTEPAGAAPPQDGRTARRDRNREAVLDAVLELFRENPLTPSPADVAERSGVSRRSVQRYFDDMDALVRAAMVRHLERVEHLFALEDVGVGPLPQRIERIVDARLRLYEAVAPMARAALLRARANPLIAERLRQGRARLRDQVGAMFAPELAALPADGAEDVAAALDVLLGFEALEHLVQVRDLDEPASRRVLVRAVGSLLAVPG
ncbi:MAG TPA: TetR/AcrR family transcriptional regulator [Acidimicrobiales bacterium]|nr:TetR/AcrR family transcriptional regulator [Acidimicrobiales bacterium]